MTYLTTTINLYSFAYQPNQLRTKEGHVPFGMGRPMDTFNVAEAEDVDVNSAIHGNWTIDNAKGRLHQFLQVNRINADYKYSTVGQDNTRLRDRMIPHPRIIIY